MVEFSWCIICLCSVSLLISNLSYQATRVSWNCSQDKLIPWLPVVFTIKQSLPLALIVKCVHLRTDTVLFSFCSASLAMHCCVYFLIFRTAYFDSVAFILGILPLYPIFRLYFPFSVYVTVVKPTKDPPLLWVWQLLPCESDQCLHKTACWEKLFSSFLKSVCRRKKNHKLWVCAISCH